MEKKTYKITDVDGKETVVESLNAFAKEVGIYYGQFYKALKSGNPTLKGNYRVEEVKGVLHYKITDPIGITHEVNSYSDFAKSIKVNPSGFKNVLAGCQKTCYGGYTIARIGDEHTTPKKEISVIESRSLQVLDVIKEGNTHKIKFKTKEGNVHTRKVEIKRVNNMNGTRCDYSGVNVPMGELYATCNNGTTPYTFSVDQIKSLGYEFKIDFDFNTKVVEKKVEIFSPDALEEIWLDKMDKVVKEIKLTQSRLTKLKEAKEYIGQSLSQTKTINERLAIVDKTFSKLF